MRKVPPGRSQGLAGARCRAFTFVELLIVVAVIAVLTALLLPALIQSKEAGRSTGCLGNLHQIGLSLQIYVQDNQNMLPVMYDRSTNSLFTNRPAMNVVLAPSVGGSSNIFRCPSDKQHLFELTGSSYAWNVLLNGQDADHLMIMTNRYPLTQIFVVFDKEKFHLTRGAARAINYLYADGHIRNLMEMQVPQ